MIGNRYTHGPGIDEHFAVAAGNDRYYYHADGLGSVMAVADSTGKVVQTYDYDSFGNLKDQKNRVKQPYTYTGREWDKETGLYYYRARYYDPMEGRFISKDPLSFDGGDVNLYGYVDSVGKPPLPQTNLYQYTENNPINKTDPLGLWSVSLGAGGFGNIGMLGGGADSGIAVSNTNLCFYSNVCSAGGWNTPAGGSLGLVAQASKGSKLCSGTEKAQGAYWYGGDGLGGEGQVMTDGKGGQYGRGLIGVTGGAGAGYMSCTTRYYCIR